MYKIMVIDDESIIRQGIINALASQPDFEVVGEAADGKEGLELMASLLPDLVITDICMPMMDGIELIEGSKAINPDVKFLIISGYADFEYAQKAIQLGVSDYLLKPVQTEELLGVLFRLKAELDEKNRFLLDLNNLQKEYTISLSLMQEWFFHELLAGNIQADELESKLNNLNLNMKGSYYGVALIHLKNFGSGNQKYPADKGFIQSYLLQIIKNIFPETIRTFLFFLNENRLVLLLSLAGGRRQELFLALNQNLKRVMVLVEKNLEIDLYASLGRLYDDLLKVSSAYAEAEEALQFSFLKGKGSLVNYEDINIHNDRQYPRPVKLEAELLLQIKLGETGQLREIVARFFQYYRNGDHLEPSRVKLFILETTILLLRTVEELGGVIQNTQTDERVDPYSQIYQCDTFEDLEGFFFNFAMDCATEIKRVRMGKNYSIVEKAKEVIEASLGNSEFSLDDVAALLYISPNYLRSLFKQQVKESFVEYLTRRRMEKAQLLLDDPTLKIYQVAEAVGFTDQHYFSICFKKYFNLTPTDYREAKKLSSSPHKAD